MIYPPAPPVVPWPVQLEALVRDGYRCRRCKAIVVHDDERRVVALKHNRPIDAANAITACIRCADEHERPR